MNIVTAAVAGVLGLGAVAVAQTPITDTPVGDASSFGLNDALDLSGRGLGVSGPGSNVFESTFADSFDGLTVTGTIRSEVFSNVSTPGSGVTDVLIVYTLTNTGLDHIDSFDFGINGGASLDASDILRAQQGTVTNATSVGQVSPDVSLDAVAVNSLWKFDFATALDLLVPGESFTWYVKSDGANAVGVVDVVVQNVFPAIGQALAFVDPNAGQPDLNVPAPGAIALAGIGLVFGGTRRRRA